MALDFPASGAAFWEIYNNTGILPEYLAPVLFHESGFNPAIQNGLGAPYYGVGQNGTADIAAYGKTIPSTYLTWPASEQLYTVVNGYFAAIIRTYGPIHSGIRCYQAEYLPGSLRTARSLSSVIASAAHDPLGFYNQNKSLDANNDGYITLADLGAVVAAAANTAQVQQAISETYAIAPGRSPHDPVYGTDFGVFPNLSQAAKYVIAGGLVLGGFLLAKHLEKHLHGSRRLSLR